MTTLYNENNANIFIGSFNILILCVVQGRLMIHQMMLLLHLEMQLRQQALVSYSQATDPEERLARLDEVKFDYDYIINSNVDPIRSDKKKTK